MIFVTIIRLIVCWLIIGFISWIGFQLYYIAGLIPIVFGILWTIKYLYQLKKIYDQAKQEDELLRERSNQEKVLPKDDET